MALTNQPYEDLTDTWEATDRFTAPANVDIKLSNTSAYFMYYVLTEDDTVPGLKVRRSHPAPPMRSVHFQMMAGERLWVAGRNARGLLTWS